MKISKLDPLSRAETEKTIKRPTKILKVALYMLVLGGLLSCDWHIFKAKPYMGDGPPKFCTDVLDNPPVTYEKLDPYSLEELLILEKCGLAYHPEHRFAWYIANRDEYPVPVLLKHLKSDEDEYFKYHLILIFVSLTESEKHRDRVSADKVVILQSIDSAIRGMTDKKIRKLSEDEFRKIRNFLIS